MANFFLKHSILFCYLLFEIGVLFSPSLAISKDSRFSWPSSYESKRPPIASRNFYRLGKKKMAFPGPFAPGTHNVAIELGQVFLMGDLSNDREDNLGFRLHYTYGVSNIFGFDSSFSYSSHSNGAFSVATLLTGLRTNLSWYDRVVPYLQFGLGFYKPSIEINELSSLSPVLFGLYVGPGIDLLVTNQVFFGTSLTFHDMFGKKERTKKGIVDVGGTFVTFLIHAGMAF